MIPSLKPPRRFCPPIDVQPEGPGEIEAANDPLALDIAVGDYSATGTLSTKETQDVLHAARRTTPNSFGLLREFSGCHSTLPLIPEHNGGVDPLVNTQPELAAVSDISFAERIQQIILPLQNLSIFRFAHWFYTLGGTTSQQSGDQLISSVICTEDFNPKDLQGVTIASVNNTLDGIDSNPLDPKARESDGWISSNITIRLPTGLRSQPIPGSATHAPGSAESFGEAFMIPGFHHRSLIQVLKSRFSDPERSKNYHYTPYKQILKKPDGTEERVVDNLYTTDAWLEEHEKIQKLEIQTDEPCNLERAAAAYMFGSDATTVAQFGQNSVWPVYGYFGNEPKWFRRKPTSRSCEHLAYIPKVRAYKSHNSQVKQLNC